MRNLVMWFAVLLAAVFAAIGVGIFGVYVWALVQGLWLLHESQIDTPMVVLLAIVVARQLGVIWLKLGNSWFK